MTLHHILEFATGADIEPVLGFTLDPSIVFMEVTSTKSFIPTANTCINCLTLPRPTIEEPLPDAKILFNLYDHAFSCSYFGNR